MVSGTILLPDGKLGGTWHYKKEKKGIKITIRPFAGTH
jgi:hypothetical protein